LNCLLKGIAMPTERDLCSQKAHEMAVPAMAIHGGRIDTGRKEGETVFRG
jgi:hypothetical protein